MKLKDIKVGTWALIHVNNEWHVRKVLAVRSKVRVTDPFGMYRLHDPERVRATFETRNQAGSAQKMARKIHERFEVRELYDIRRKFNEAVESRDAEVEEYLNGKR